ncbi:MAG TPA: ferritin-like domain-containing protein [Acidimicrobiales bacterium]|nr:ferritin-like domain-containing protein [Acidimicrobiales bacterium]
MAVTDLTGGVDARQAAAARSDDDRPHLEVVPAAPGARARLVRLLQDAHAGELAAAYAYGAHARSLRGRPQERAEVYRIEAAEVHHRKLVAEMLVDLGARPRRRRELLMGATGRFFGLLCFVTGWFGPMYAAGRLEAMNVDQYRVARDLAAGLGFDCHRDRLEAMRVEEVRHERWFGDRVRGHWLLPVTRLFLGWTPPPPPPASEPEPAAISG